jgi:hypothetical protein
MTADFTPVTANFTAMAIYETVMRILSFALFAILSFALCATGRSKPNPSSLHKGTSRQLSLVGGLNHGTKLTGLNLSIFAVVTNQGDSDHERRLARDRKRLGKGQDKQRDVVKNGRS